MARGSAQTKSLIGELLGKDYRVLEQIGQGGMAVVYLVEHQTLQKRFAAKVLSPEHAESEEARARFAQEAHSASQLDHENIVTISDFGVTEDERPYFVMELLRGRTLDTRLEEGPMSIEEVVAVSVPVARALAHAHAEGVIHRDIKPENVFLVQRTQGRWTVKVVDFGIAKVTVNPKLTKMGQALGSPMFMAPEACKGDEVDNRTDIYSFGILLYLMTTGRVPFEDESLLKVLQMQVMNPLPPPSQYKPDISPELEGVILRALEKNPDDRYPTMDAMLFDLEAALPQGSDALLIQAQFGTSLHDTPFPSQRAIRTSQQNMAAVRVSQQNIAALRQSQQHIQVTSSSLPPAPQKSGRSKLIVVGVVGVLAIGAMSAYGWYRQQQGSKPDTTAVANVPPVAPPQAPPQQPPPTDNPAATPNPPPTDNPAVDNPGSADPPIDDLPPPEDPKNTKRVVGKPKGDETKDTPKKGNPKTVAAKTPPVKTQPKTTPKTPTETGSAKTPAGSGNNVATTNPTPTETKAVLPPTPTPPVVPPDAALPKAPEKPAAGSMDATPSIGSLDVNGPLPSSTVRRAVDRVMPALRTCYREAAKAQKQTPPITLTLTFEVDESSNASGVSAKGTAFGSLLGCAKSAIGRVQTQQAPDVGTVHVVVSVSFKPIYASDARLRSRR